jgi:hypothetical protein
MKTVFTLLLTFCLTIMGAAGLQAQGSLGLYTTSVSDNTPAMGDQLSLFTKLINVSPTDTFKGIVDFGLANNGGPITDLAVFGKPALAGTNITLAPLEEKNLLFTVEIVPAYFTPGSDIIIVWPVANTNIVDSARANVYISGTTGMEDTKANSLQVFVAANRLFVLNTDVKCQLEQLRIIDLQGRVVANYPISGTNFNAPLNELSGGVYLAEITTTTGTRRVLKFVR